MLSYNRRLPSGHFTCYLNRTYHVLTTVGTKALDFAYRIYLDGRSVKKGTLHIPAAMESSPNRHSVRVAAKVEANAEK
jgi:hypothetical protein